MQGADKTAALLTLLRTPTPGDEANAQESAGFKILKVVTTEPAPYTFIFEGTQQALDLDLFEIPVACYPLAVGDRLLVFPIVGDGMRWAAFAKLNNAVTIATITGPTQVQVEGIGRPYGAGDLILPQGANLPAGYTVSLQPAFSGGKIKYAVLNIHEGG